MFDIDKTEEGNVFWVRLCYDMLDRNPFTIYQWKPLIAFFEENDILELEWRRWEDVLGDKIHKIYAFDITSAAKILHEWSTSTFKDKHDRLISYLIKYNEHPTTESNIIYI